MKLLLMFSKYMTTTPFVLSVAGIASEVEASSPPLRPFSRAQDRLRYAQGERCNELWNAQ